MKKVKISVFAITAFLTLSACSSDDSPTPVNEEEVITTVTATFTAGEDTVTLTSRDLDGDGPNAPVITVSGNFEAGVTYAGSISFLNETVSPPEEITEEISEEGDEHQIFFQQNGLGQFTYSDEDVNGDPVGLEFSFIASNGPATGNLTITLRHEPNKSANGVANGVITNAGGNTDAEVTFPVVVE